MFEAEINMFLGILLLCKNFALDGNVRNYGSSNMIMQKQTKINLDFPSKAVCFH
jgi:hypothetical protein